ncbi:MAG: peptidyl-tRNA hydrolase [Candidatus Phytoplasma cynodontis]|nr:MAG: peptidyl-tRNA hydrolase [Candidatus Phytoplasma cynodontis]
MKLIVGLGNPEDKYKYTPHNIGFLMIDFFLEKIKEKNILYEKKKEFNFFYFIKFNNQKVILFKPYKFMNLSGIEIKKIVSFYKINIEDILVLSDDIYLKIGDFKLKRKGGYGGHNGLKNIINNLKTECFKRLKIGVGYDEKIRIEEYVLRSLSNYQIQKIMNNFDFLSQVLFLFINGMPFDQIISFSKR